MYDEKEYFVLVMLKKCHINYPLLIRGIASIYTRMPVRIADVILNVFFIIALC